MKKLVFAAAMIAAAPAFAQSTPANDHSAHAGHAAHGQAAAKFSLDTPIETIAADANGKAALDANLPGLTSHPQYDMFKAMTLNQIAPMAGDKMPAEALAKVAAALAAIK